jgi:hypothetical protein
LPSNSFAAVAWVPQFLIGQLGAAGELVGPLQRRRRVVLPDAGDVSVSVCGARRLPRLAALALRGRRDASQRNRRRQRRERPNPSWSHRNPPVDQ